MQGTSAASCAGHQLLWRWWWWWWWCSWCAVSIEEERYEDEYNNEWLSRSKQGKIGKMWELFFDTYHGTMIRKKRCVRGWNLSSCCIYTFDQPRSSPSWSNSNLLKIIYPKPRCHEIPYKMHANTFKRGKNECRMGPLRWRNEHVVERITKQQRTTTTTTNKHLQKIRAMTTTTTTTKSLLITSIQRNKDKDEWRRSISRDGGYRPFWTSRVMCLSGWENAGVIFGDEICGILIRNDDLIHEYFVRFPEHFYDESS